MDKVLISSCLIGLQTRWNGQSKEIKALTDLVNAGNAVFACPEQLAGFSTPRQPAEIEPGKTSQDVLSGKGKVFDKTGEDVTAQFIAGANKTLELCQNLGIKKAILKEKSPSCGVALNYDGTFSGQLKPGSGITAELLRQNGIEVISEEEYLKL